MNYRVVKMFITYCGHLRL